MVKSMLSDADAREVAAAVARLERETSAEVVVAVLPESADYVLPRVLLAAAWAFAAGFAFLEWLPWRHPAWSLVVEAVVAFGIYALSGFTQLRRHLISAHMAEHAVQQRAQRLFAERGLHVTRGRTGLLIFVSELERRVVLLGDRALDEKLGPRAWEEQVAELAHAIKAGRAREGIVNVLSGMAARLSGALPRAEDDQNELPDDVLRG